jgi:uncharacterized membrane protein (DUF2068 family)
MYNFETTPGPVLECYLHSRIFLDFYVHGNIKSIMIKNMNIEIAINLHLVLILAKTVIQRLKQREL